MSRYYNRVVANNNNQSYTEFLEEKQIKSIRQYTSPEFNKISAIERSKLKRVSLTWKLGDRLWKYAADFYNDPSLWWVIAWYNQKPTEGHFQIGDTILIPLPIESVLELFER